jgi:hypothetical protein
MNLQDPHRDARMKKEREKVRKRLVDMKLMPNKPNPSKT